MTREERELSIAYLEGIKEKYIDGEGYERHPLPEYYAIEMAIKALEAPPNDNWEGYSKRLWKSAYESGKADAEQRWIPVSERLPEEYGEYMITWTTSNSIARKHGFLGTAEYELTGEYDAENNRFKGEWLLEDYVKHYKDVKVIAWMPLPEPYKAESEEV